MKSDVTDLAASAPVRMGAAPLAKGVAFTVWAPHADEVSVVGFRTSKLTKCS